MKKVNFIFIILIIIFFGCEKKFELKNENKVNDNINNQVFSSIEKIVYIIPYDGLNLRSEPDITSTRIKLLSQNTKLTVLERSKTQVLIDNILDYWYKVDTGEDTGWVFGGYISSNPVRINNKNKQIPKFITEMRIEFFGNGLIYFIEGAIEYTNRDILKIYNRNTIESDYYFTDCKKVYLIKIPETQNWFYSISYDAIALGYIYIYDITEKSFYGNIEENKKSGNYYMYLLEKEYEITKQYQNIKRYGPLLMIKHNEGIIEFWDKFSGKAVGYKILLLDYYLEYNEILIMEQYYEGSSYFIYNLDFEEYRCKDTENPSFNISRTYLCSLSYLDDLGDLLRYSINLFRINDGFYQEIFKEGIYIQRNWHIENIIWLNDHEVHIDYRDAGKIIIKINDDRVHFLNNMVPLP
jgi:hypothetical protein